MYLLGEGAMKVLLQPPGAHQCAYVTQVSAKYKSASN